MMIIVLYGSAFALVAIALLIAFGYLVPKVSGSNPLGRTN